MLHTTKNAEETKNFGEALATALMREKREGPLIIALSGELGSGKTTFTQGFARGLGISSRLLSPTFIIVRRYPIPGRALHFYHIDLYRTQQRADLDSLGLGELFTDPFSVIIVEWAERLGSQLPKKRIDVAFEVIGEDERKITIKSKIQIPNLK